MQNDTPLLGCEILHFSAHDASHPPLGVCERKTLGRAVLDRILELSRLWHKPWEILQHNNKDALRCGFF